MTESEDDVGAAVISGDEREQVERANADGRTPVVFVHGLWLLPNSWDKWAAFFDQNGFAPVSPGWPDDPETVAEAKDHPEVFAGKGIKEIADHYEAVIRLLDGEPVIVGHSFGGLLTQILAGRGLARASVAMSPAPFQGVLPLPVSALRAASPVLRNPRNRHRAVPLTYEQFRYAFANAVPEDEARSLYEEFSVPGSGEPIFQAAGANFNPWSEDKVDTDNPDRGPLLIISGDHDHTVPWAIANSEYKHQSGNPAGAEILKVDRGHSMTIDSGWEEVAGLALDFLRRHLPA